MNKPIKIFYLLQQAHGSIFRSVNQALLSRYGITAAQQGVLLVLAEQDGQSVSALAAATSLKKSSISGLIDRMADTALVTRKTDGKDHRIQKVFLLKRGKKMIETTSPYIEKLNSRILNSFTLAEQATIEKFLQSVNQHADELSTEAID